MNGAREVAHGAGHSAVHGAPGGLAVSAAGCTLQVSPKTFEAGQEEAFGLRILERGGHTVRVFDEQHGERMHLMVVRRDLAHYQHLHPSLGTDGAWSVPLVLPEPGVYRAFADFSVGGESLTLGADLHVPGEMELASLDGSGSDARVDGYEVELDAGALTAGAASSLTFRIAQEGHDVEEPEPYLGALGHLVALREGDLAFLHVHPPAAPERGSCFTRCSRAWASTSSSCSSLTRAGCTPWASPRRSSLLEHGHHRRYREEPNARRGRRPFGRMFVQRRMPDRIRAL